MDVSKCVRNANAVKKELITHKDGTVTSKKECVVTVPLVWEEKGMFIRGESILVTAICPIIIDGTYSVLNVLAKMVTDPSTIQTVTIDDTEYIAMYYEPGDRILARGDVVKDDGLPYFVFDTLIDKGRIPWFLSYDDIGKLFDSSIAYAGLKFNIDHAIFEMVASLIARDRSDRSKFYRHAINKKPTADTTYIPMRSVQYGASNTTAKLIGAYWSEGLTSALVHPSERKELIEDLLRS